MSNSPGASEAVHALAKSPKKTEAAEAKFQAMAQSFKAQAPTLETYALYAS